MCIIATERKALILKVYSYGYGSMLGGIVSKILKEHSGHEDRLRFVIPSRKDKYLWPEHNDGRKLWTWQYIYEDICISSGSNRKRVLSPPDHLLILKSILKEALSEYPDKVKALPGLQRPGFLSVLSDDIHELLNEAVRPSQLPHNPESDNPSEFLLPEVYSRYLEYLGNNSLLDSSQVYTAAYEALLEHKDWGKDLVMIFTGFLSFNHGQLELVEAVRDRCSETIIIKPEAFIKGFHDASSQLGEYTPSVPTSGRILSIPSADPSLEPEIIARTLALWHSGQWQEAGGFPGFDAIGLMIDEGRQEAFTEAFGRYGVPCGFMEGMTVSGTLPGKIVAALRHLSSRQFPAYDTAMLLTLPCFAGSTFPVMRAFRAGRSGLEHWEEYLKERVNDPNEKSPEVFRRALLSVQAIKKFCEAIKKHGLPSQIMKAFHDFLTTHELWLERYDDIADYPELDESRRITASAIQTVGEKVLALTELLPDLGRVQDKRLEGDDAYDFLEEWCRNSHIRHPVQLSDSVRIFTGTPPVLASFSVWIMSGITQKLWSPNMKSSPLLGNEEREKLREYEAYLPRTKEKADQREALFRRLIQTGEKLTVISRPLLDSEGRPVGESPFVGKFLDDMPGWKMEALSSEGINILLGSDGFTFPAIDPDETARIPREVPCITGKADSVGASDIQELLGCPFMWWQKRQAELYQPDTQLFSATEQGNMLHKYWQCVWSSYREDMAATGSTFKEIAKSEWKKLLALGTEDYAKFSGLVKDSRFRRRLDGLKFRAERLALVQAGIIDALHDAGYFHERILLEDEIQMKAAVDGVAFLGQCDRVEFMRRPGGSPFAFIADYKEGRKKSSGYDEGMKDITGKYWNTKKDTTVFKHGLQLSVYAALFGKNYGGYDLSGVYILGHEDGRISGTFSHETAGIFAKFMCDDGKGGTQASDTDMAGRISEGKYAMECAVRVLERGKFEPEYSSGPCRYCHIKSLCRKGEFRGEVAGDDGNDADSEGE